MLIQFTGIDKGQAAFFAYVRTFFGVRPYMYLQRMRGVELLQTRGALKVSRALVALQMICQIATIAEFHPAYVADILKVAHLVLVIVFRFVAESSSLWFMFGAYVSIEICEFLEIHAAQIALERINVGVNETELFVKLEIGKEFLFCLQTLQTFLFGSPICGTQFDNAIFNAFRIYLHICGLLYTIAQGIHVALLHRPLVEVGITYIPKLWQILVDFNDFKGDVT